MIQNLTTHTISQRPKVTGPDLLDMKIVTGLTAERTPDDPKDVIRTK